MCDDLTQITDSWIEGLCGLNSMPGEVTWLQSESIAVHNKYGKECVFQYQAAYRVDPCLGYQLLLFWDKRGTFLILWSVMQNMDISHNLQNDGGRCSSESELGIIKTLIQGLR